MKRTIQIGKQSLSLFLAVLMVVFTLPLSVFANELNSNTELPAEDYSVSFIKDIFEVEELRDETVKHFRLEDGSYIAAQYDKPVHYLDENGEWQDIDNTLAESGSEISTGNARVKFAKKITGNEAILTLHENNRKITLSLDGAIKKTKGTIINSEDDDGSTKLQKMMSLEKLTATVLYEDILDGVDLEYIVDSYDIKENIIVKEKADAYSYSFTMRLNNLYAALDESGQILLTDSKTEEIAYIIPAPTAYDADDVYAERALLYYTLIDNGNGKYSLTVTVDADWMNSDDRAYPVVVDPPISVPSSTVTDLDIDSTTPDICYANDTSMCVGQNWKSYWKTSTLPYIPASAYITNANISLYSTVRSVNYVGVYQVTTDWDSTLTWNKAIADNPQGVIASFPVDYNCIDGTSAVNNRYNWDITEIVRSWYAGYYENYGIAFQIVSGTTPSYIYSVFKTSESSNAPQFTITYKDMKGVENYWTFGTQSAGLAGNGYVNYATGNLTFSKSLLSTTDSLMAYSPAFVYNSALANDEYEYPNAEISYWGTYMPRGFKLSINETIIQREYTSADGETLYMYILSDADGTEHYFLPVKENGVRSTTKYQDEDGLQLILDTSTNTTLTITDNAKNVRYYEKLSGVPSSGILGGWYLSRIADSTGNEIVFGFETGPRPNTVSIKPNGSTQIEFLKIAYNSGYMPYIILNETSKEAMLFRYSTTYDGDITNANTNYLRKVEYAHSTEALTLSEWNAFYNSGSNSTKIVVDASAEYTYDSNGNLTIAKDNLSGYEIRYTYSSAGKVTNIQEYAGTTPGQTLSYTYRTGYTLVQSSGSDDVYGTDDDLVTRYIFDNEGRVSSMYTIDNSRTQVYGATTGVYEEQDNVKNNLKSTVVIGGSTSNYLLNGGFEKSTATLADHWSISSGNVSFVQTEIPGGGDRMAKIAVNANSVASICQYTFLKAGEYTLSASVLPLNCDNVKLFMKAESLSDASNIYIEEVPLSKKHVEGQSDFGTMTFTSVGESFKISFIVESGTISNTNVSVAIDNVMLEENIGASDYSMIQCGNFEAFAIDDSGTAIDNTASFWTNQDGTLAGVTAHEPFGHAGYVNGEITEERYIKQTVYTAPEEYLTQYDTDPTSLDLQSKTFIVSGFGKGAGQSYSENSRFGLRVEVYYYQGNGIEVLDEEPKYLEFEHDCADWQFVCGSFDTVDGALISRIVVYCDYSYQLDGMAIFDEIALFESNDDSVVKYTYYANGLLKTQESGYVTEVYEYNDDRQITRVANSLGYITDYVYQDDGITVDHEIFYTFKDTNNKSIPYPSDAEDPDAIIRKTPVTKTVYNYNNYGQMIKATTYEVEYNNDVDQVIVAKNGTEVITADKYYNTSAGSHIFGSLDKEVDNRGVTTEYYYDNTNGRLLAVTNTTEGNGTCYTYDAIGNITSVLPAAYVSSTSYQAVTDSNSVAYTYNDANLLETITTESTKYSFVYDGFGNTDSVSIGTNEIVNYEYNSYNGKLHTINYANGFSVEYVYDQLENISEVWYTEDGVSTKAYEYHYTAYGQLARFDNLLTGKSIAYKYDDDNRLIGFVEYDTDDASDIFAYAAFYDAKSRPGEVRYSLDYTAGTANANADVRYEYRYNETDGTLDYYNITANGFSGHINYIYDGFKRLSGKTYGCVDVEDDTTGFYNTVNYTFVTSPFSGSSVATTKTSSLIKTVTSWVVGHASLTYTYDYDSNGNITKIALSNGQEYRYVYDDLGQLLREDNTALGKTYVYTYDKAGNILTKTTYALTAAGVTPSSPISTYNYGYTDANWGDKLTSYRGVSFTYDEVGNPLTYYNGSNYSFTWKNGRQLATLTNGSNSLSFEYNDEGIRTQKTVNGVVHTYHLSDSRIIAEEWGDNLLLYLYDAEGSPVGMQYRKSSYAEGVFDTYWFEKNLQGDIITVYDAAGTKLIAYTYDAWGNCTTTYHNGGASTTATYNPFRYRGYYLDTETGFYYLNSRYYDPVIGRFINADDVELLGADGTLLSYNLFAYCKNNPVSYSDPSGHFAFLPVLGAVVGGVIGAVSTAIQGKSMGEVILSGVCGAISGAFSATGLGGVVGQMAVGALTSVVDSGFQNYNDYKNGKKSLTEAVLGTVVDTAIGTTFAAMGAKGTKAFETSKKITSNASAALNTLSMKGIHPNTRAAANQVWQQSKKYFARESINSVIDNVSTTVTGNFISDLGGLYISGY